MRLQGRATFRRGEGFRAKVSRGIVDAAPSDGHWRAPREPEESIDPELASRLATCVTARQRARVRSEWKRGGGYE